MSFKTAGQATLGFLSARRRLEDGLKCFSKRRQSRRESLHGDRELLHFRTLYDGHNFAHKNVVLHVLVILILIFLWK